MTKIISLVLLFNMLFAINTFAQGDSFDSNFADLAYHFDESQLEKVMPNDTLRSNQHANKTANNANPASLSMIASTSTLTLVNIDFSVYLNPSVSALNIQFLNPEDQQMEMYLIDLSGDLVANVLEPSMILAGVKTLNFDFPSQIENGTYFLVIKAHGRSLIQKIDWAR